MHAGPVDDALKHLTEWAASDWVVRGGWSAVSQALIQRLLQGVTSMRESITYQAILQEGKAEGEASEARRILLLQGRRRFGEPAAAALAALNSVSDLQKLEDLTVRLLEVETWEELLASAASSRRRRGRKKR
jgi:predicted transposase YdaD